MSLKCLDEFKPGELPKAGPAAGATGGVGALSGLDRETAIECIREGADVHNAVNYLTWVGVDKATIVEAFERAPWREDDPKRWAARLKDIDRSISGAERRKTRDLTAKFNAPPKPIANVAEGLGTIETKTLLHVRDFMLSQTRRDWIIDQYLGAGVVAMLIGHSQAGKSMEAVNLACCIATGRAMRGRRTRRGVVAYIAGEGRPGLKLRFRAWAQHHDADLRRCGLFVNDSHFNLMREADQKQLVDALDALPEAPSLIIFDTKASLTPGLNSNEMVDLGRLVSWTQELISRFGCSVIWVDHTPDSNKMKVKGAGTLYESCDTAFVLMNPTEDRRHTGRVIINAKQRDIEPVETQKLQFQRVELTPLAGPDEFPEFEASSVFVPMARDEVVKEKVDRSPNLAILIDALRGMDDEGGSRADLEREFLRLKDADPAKRTGKMAFQRAFNSAVDAGVIRENEAGTKVVLVAG